MKNFKNLQTLFLVGLFVLVATPGFAVEADVIDAMNELVNESEITGGEDAGEADKVVEEALALEAIAEELSEEIEKQEEVTGDIVDMELEILDETALARIERTPGAFGLWWRSVRENVSLVLTFSSVKKAEKRLQYAEERIEIAKLLAEKADTPKIAERIQKVILKAEGFMEKIEKDRDKVEDKMGDRKDVFLENIAKHRVNKERVLEQIEDKIPAEKLEKFQEMREMTSERSSEFFSSFLKKERGSKELIEKIKEKSRDLRVIITNREKVREEVKVLMNKAKGGDDIAGDKLIEKREGLKNAIEERRAGLVEKRDELIEKVKAGDKDAILELKSWNMQIQSKVRRALDAQSMIKRSLAGKVKKGDNEARERLEGIKEIEKNIIQRVKEGIREIQN